MPQTFEPQVLDHPLIQHKISLMRKKETGSKDFRCVTRRPGICR